MRPLTINDGGLAGLNEGMDLYAGVGWADRNTAPAFLTESVIV